MYIVLDCNLQVGHLWSLVGVVCLQVKSLSCNCFHQWQSNYVINNALKTLALYKPFTYLLTYLLTRTGMQPVISQARPLLSVILA